MSLIKGKADWLRIWPAIGWAILLSPLIGSACFVVGGILGELVFDEGLYPANAGAIGLFFGIGFFSLIFVVPSMLVFAVPTALATQVLKLPRYWSLGFIVLMAALAQTTVWLFFLVAEDENWPAFFELSGMSAPFALSAAIILWWKLNPPRAGCSQSQ